MLTDIQIFNQFFRIARILSRGENDKRCTFYSTHGQYLQSYFQFKLYLTQKRVDPDQFLFFCYFWKNFCRYLPNKNIGLQAKIIHAQAEINKQAKEQGEEAVEPFIQPILGFIAFAGKNGAGADIANCIYELKKLEHSNLIGDITFSLLKSKPAQFFLKDFFRHKAFLAKHYFPLTEKLESYRHSALSSFSEENPPSHKHAKPDKQLSIIAEEEQRDIKKPDRCNLALIPIHQEGALLLCCLSSTHLELYSVNKANATTTPVKRISFEPYDFQPQQIISMSGSGGVIICGKIKTQHILLIYNPNQQQEIHSVKLNDKHHFLFCTKDHRILLFRQDSFIFELLIEAGSYRVVDTQLMIEEPMKVQQVAELADSFYLIGLIERDTCFIQHANHFRVTKNKGMLGQFHCETEELILIPATQEVLYRIHKNHTITRCQLAYKKQLELHMPLKSDISCWILYSETVLLIADSDNWLYFYDLIKNEITRTIRFFDRIDNMYLSADKQTLYYLSQDKPDMWSIPPEKTMSPMMARATASKVPHHALNPDSAMARLKARSIITSKGCCLLTTANNLHSITPALEGKQLILGTKHPSLGIIVSQLTVKNQTQRKMIMYPCQSDQATIKQTITDRKNRLCAMLIHSPADLVLVVINMQEPFVSAKTPLKDDHFLFSMDNGDVYLCDLNNNFFSIDPQSLKPVFKFKVPFAFTLLSAKVSENHFHLLGATAHDIFYIKYDKNWKKSATQTFLVGNTQNIEIKCEDNCKFFYYRTQENPNTLHKQSLHKQLFLTQKSHTVLLEENGGLKNWTLLPNGKLLIVYQNNLLAQLSPTTMTTLETWRLPETIDCWAISPQFNSFYFNQGEKLYSMQLEVLDAV